MKQQEEEEVFICIPFALNGIAQIEGKGKRERKKQ